MKEPGYEAKDISDRPVATDVKPRPRASGRHIGAQLGNEIVKRVCECSNGDLCCSRMQ